MNYATHFKHPEQTPGSAFVRMLCGRIKHSRTEEIKTSENPDEVTCTKCLGYHDNPARALRQYGQVLLIQPYGFSLIPSWGFHIHIIATSDGTTGHWKFLAKNDSTTWQGEFHVSTFKDAIRYITKLAEDKILNKKNNHESRN